MESNTFSYILNSEKDRERKKDIPENIWVYECVYSWFYEHVFECTHTHTQTQRKREYIVVYTYMKNKNKTKPKTIPSAWPEVFTNN